jgi:hypothetical protein
MAMMWTGSTFCYAEESLGFVCGRCSVIQQLLRPEIPTFRHRMFFAFEKAEKLQTPAIEARKCTIRKVKLSENEEKIRLNL